MSYDSQRQYFVYLLTSYTNRVIYCGVTNNLIRRVQEHRDKVNEGFTNRYAVWKLVYFEEGADISGAIMREKLIKGGPRAKMVALIASVNPTWRDLYRDLVEDEAPAKIASSWRPRNDK